MILEIDGDRYSLRRHPSIFTSRNNASVKKEDVIIELILKPGEHCRFQDVGISRDKMGRRQCLAMLASESGEPVGSGNRALPSELSIDYLRQIGMVD